jgi:hypothetical protein
VYIYISLSLSRSLALSLSLFLGSFAMPPASPLYRGMVKSVGKLGLPTEELSVVEAAESEVGCGLELEGLACWHVGTQIG